MKRSAGQVQEKRAAIPDIKLPRSQFDMSSTLKTAFDAQDIIPFYQQEVIPGDSHNISVNGLLRLSTPLYPFMDNLYMDVHFFFVPHRIIWTNFKKMMGEQDNPADSVDFTVPQITATKHAVGDLYDQYGIPPNTTNNIAHANLLPRGYNAIYNAWFRDENLQDSITVDIDDGPDTATDYAIKKRGKRHDYFTSCLPWTQKTGATEVLMPLGTSAPINVDAADTVEVSIYNDAYSSITKLDIGATRLEGSNQSGSAATQLYADLQNASAATINQFRQAEAVQVLYERDARGGTRYPELIWSHFGVENAGGDARMQRPEFLGSWTGMMNINPIAQQSNDGVNGAVGELSAIGTGTIANCGFSKSFTEHGYIHGLISIRGEKTYQQGIQRHWLRNDKLDFYWPSLAQLGEMAITNKEIWTDGSANDDLVFGYQEVFGDLRYKPSEIHGIFRSDAAGSLDAWHLSEDFASLPTLGSTFITDATPVDRVVATPADPNVIADFWIQQYSARPLPIFGTPATLGRF